MKKYKLDCWYRYAGAIEKDFLTVVLIAKNLEDAIETVKIENNCLHFFRFDIKICLPISVIEEIDFLIEYSSSISNNFLKNKLTEIKLEL